MFILIFFLLEIKSVIIYVNETIHYPLTDFFGYLENPTYQIVDPQNSYLSIIPQFNSNGDTQAHSQNAGVIISAKGEFLHGYWTNQFFFLELNNGTYYIHYSENPQFENEAAPKFDHRLLVTDLENYVCYDVELFYGTYFIVDCVVKTEEQIFENKLLIISKDNVIEAQTVSSQLEYQSNQKRKLQLSSNSGEYRFFLFQAFMQGGDESIIQFYYIRFYQFEDQTIILFSQSKTISTDWLKQKLNLSDSYSFNLLDFKVIDDQIGLLDKQFFCILSLNYWKQLEMEYFLEFTEEVIAFDFFEDFNDLGLSNRIHVILKKNSFDLYQNKTKLILTQLLKTPASDYAQIKISQKYIIIEDNGKLFQYKINETVLLWQETLPGFHKYLINPQYPDFIQIGNNYTKRYSISEGYLHIQSSSSSLDPMFYTIKAVSLQKSIDQQFPLQILKENDGMMYLNGKSKSIITDAVYSTQQQQYVIPFVSSPKIEIGVDPLDNPHDIEFVIKNDMFIKEWPATDSIHFQDMLLYNDNLIYVFFQLKDKSIQLWKCNQTLDSLIESCKEVKLVSEKKIKFTVFINQTNVQWWIQGPTYRPTYRFSYVEDVNMWQYTIEEWSYNLGKFSYWMPVTEITRLRKNLVYLFAQNKTLHIQYDDFQGTIIIDENYVKKLGITFDWSPKKLFGNYKYQNHLLLIQNEDNLMVAIFQETFHIVKSFPITGDIEITINKDTFFLSRILSGKSILEQYSIKDIHNIYLMRSIQLFNYEFYSPLTIAQSRDSGFLFILAKSQQVLVFKPNQENSNDDLFRVFDVQFQDFVTMSACGYKKTHFYFNNGTDSTYFAILKQSQMTVKSKKPKKSIQGEDYFSNFTQYMFFRNNQHKYDFGVKIENLNIQQNFTLHDQQKLSVPRDQSFYRVPLNNLYSGEVLSLTCEGCDSNIQLITPLQIQSQKKPNYYIEDFQKYSSSYDVILSYDLKFIDHDQNLKQALKVGYDCLYMQVQQNSKFIILLCEYFYDYDIEYPDYTFKLITCDILLNCSIQDIVSDEINLAKKMILLTNNLVLVLDLGKILVYYIDGQMITYTQLIQGKTAFTNFIVQEYDEGGKNYNILTIIDESKNLNILFAEFAENKLKIISNSSISIQNLMIKSGYFASNTMVYVQLFATQSAKKGQLNYIVVSDHEASASLQIILNNNKEIVSATVKQVFIPYSDWIISEGLAAQFDEWLLLPYQNENNYLLALYHINNSQAVQNIIYAHLIPRSCVPDVSYYKWFIWYGPVIYSFNKTSFNLYTCGGEDEESAITIFNIRNYPELLFNQTNDLQHTQTIILTANNIQNIQSINLTIEKSGPSPDPTPNPIPDTSSHIYIWIIVFIALGSITLIGIILVIYMKYKQIGWFKVHINGYQEHVEI